MFHWQASSILCFLLTGKYKPLCASVHSMNDSVFRRSFIEVMDMLFSEVDHTRRVYATWLIGDLLRNFKSEYHHSSEP